MNWSCAFQHSALKTIRGYANIMSFPEQPTISPFLSLKDYLVRTAPLHAVDAKYMFIQLRKPYKSVSSQTLAHWIMSIMADAGVDTTIFRHHSTRSSLAALLESGFKKMSVAQICKQGQWSRLTTTYTQCLRRRTLANFWKFPKPTFDPRTC